MTFPVPEDGQFQHIYDELYANCHYNWPSARYEFKYAAADDFAKRVGGRILDAGCGSGHSLRRLVEAGVDAFGVEWSATCCEKHLSDLPHECADLVEFCSREDTQFDGIVCSDTLEHFAEDRLDEALTALRRVAPRALYPIGNNRDSTLGYQLHLTRKPMEWWKDLLEKYYTKVTFSPGPKPAFFILECWA